VLKQRCHIPSFLADYLGILPTTRSSVTDISKPRKVITLGQTRIKKKVNRSLATARSERAGGLLVDTEMVEPGREIDPRLANELHNLCGRVKGVRFRTTFIMPTSDKVLVHVRVQVSINGQIRAVEKKGGKGISRKYLKHVAVGDLYGPAVEAIALYKEDPPSRDTST